MKITSPIIAGTTTMVAAAMWVLLERELIIVVIRVVLLWAVVGETLSLSQDDNRSGYSIYCSDIDWSFVVCINKIEFLIKLIQKTSNETLYYNW